MESEQSELRSVDSEYQGRATEPRKPKLLESSQLAQKRGQNRRAEKGKV